LRNVFQHLAFEQLSIILIEVSVPIIGVQTPCDKPNLGIDRVSEGVCWHCRWCIREASIERIVLPHRHEAGPHPHHSFPVRHFLTNECREESHAYLRGRLCGEVMQEEISEPTKSNGVYTQSPDEAATRFEEAQMIRWDSCNMQAMMHQAYASGSLSTRRPVMI
jgi:hypothetical protein